MPSVLLASGGLDSSVIAATEPDIAVHLSINYGQIHAAAEIAAAQRIATYYGAEHVMVMAARIAELMPSSLTGAPGALEGPATVVPNRNAILLSMGVALAMARGCNKVLIGCNHDDYPVYPDCRPDFLTAANRMAMAASEGTVILGAPLLYLTKPGIGRLAHEHNVPTEHTYSCYAGGDEHCGECGACIQRGRALDVHHHPAL